MTNQLTAKQEAFAQALYRAYQEVDALKESDWQEVVSDDQSAYQVQARVMELKGEPVGGYKVSLTSEQTQKMFESDCPLYGAQVADRFLMAPATVSLQNLNEPLVEVELAFRAKEDLDASASLEDLFTKTTVAGAVEVPDARFVNWFPDLSKYMVMSDCAVGGLVVYGFERDTQEVFADVADVAKVQADLFFNDEKVGGGQASEVLGNPLKALKWLVDTLDAQGKGGLKKGQVVSSGTFLLPPALKAGKWEARFDRGFGDVTVKVTK
ncbi:2-keto-4-pentenoate hydratase [Ligilactobacillus equi]|nr:2-keto-4-pentenoate hydratase [Ligilactobacillus equi]MCQ2557439.1 2-keto-4-pentenoate hydratase [Ligilactobacillus sp.]